MRWLSARLAKIDDIRGSRIICAGLKTHLLLRIAFSP